MDMATLVQTLNDAVCISHRAYNTYGKSMHPNSVFKPVKLILKIDLVSHPTNWVDIYIHI